MRKFIKYLFLLGIVAFIIATALYFLNHKFFMLHNKDTPDSLIIAKNYTISNVGRAEELTPPQDRDIDFSYISLVDETPDFSGLPPGKSSVVKVQDGYKKLRSQIPIFGEMQERLDPLALVIDSGAFTLESLYAVVNDNSLLRRSGKGIYILSVPLVIEVGAILSIQEGDSLLLSAEKGALISNFGNLYINRAIVKGWNVEQNQPAFYKNPQAFRPYIVSWCGSRSDIVQSEIGYLGYEDSKSYGLTYTSCADTLYEEDSPVAVGATGKIINSRIKDLYFGFYSYEAVDISIVGNQFDTNIVYGIDPHDRSKNLIIADNKVTGTREKHGIILSRDITNTYIVNNYIEQNAGSGIMLDRNSRQNIISDNVVSNNTGDGISIYESPGNFFKRNKVTENGSVGLRVRNSWNIVSLNDTFQSNRGGAVQLYTDHLKDRDTMIDPYKKRAALELISAELLNHPQAVFKLEKFDRFILRQPHIFKSGEKLFKGDLKGVEKHISKALYDDGAVIIERAN